MKDSPTENSWWISNTSNWDLLMFQLGLTSISLTKVSGYCRSLQPSLGKSSNYNQLNMSKQTRSNMFMCRFASVMWPMALFDKSKCLIYLLNHNICCLQLSLCRQQAQMRLYSFNTPVLYSNADRLPTFMYTVYMEGRWSIAYKCFEYRVKLHGNSAFPILLLYRDNMINEIILGIGMFAVTTLCNCEYQLLIMTV